MTVTIRPARQDDLHACWGDEPRPGGRAWAIDYNGQVASVACVWISPIGMVAMWDMVPGVKAPAITIFRTAKKMLELMLPEHAPLFACGNGDFLTMLGFTPCERQWNGVQFYSLRR